MTEVFIVVSVDEDATYPYNLQVHEVYSTAEQAEDEFEIEGIKNGCWLFGPYPVIERTVV